MKLLSLLSRLFTRDRAWKAPHVKQASRRERELRLLVSTGRITLNDIEGNHPAKELFRLRELGFVYPKGEQESWEKNPRTGCQYKVYKWTGKVPANWISAPNYVGAERRSKRRAQ